METRKTVTKHTQKPWYLELERSTKRDTTHVIANGYAIAKILNLGEYDFRRAERDANACLIVAAPELLEAMVELLDSLDDPRVEFSMPDHMHKYLAAARFAVKRAKGL